MVTVDEFNTSQELADALTALDGNDVQVFTFSGERLFVSKPPYRYLMLPNAQPIPLFAIPSLDTLVADVDGCLSHNKPDPDYVNRMLGGLVEPLVAEGEAEDESAQYYGEEDYRIDDVVTTTTSDIDIPFDVDQEPVFHAQKDSS